MQVTLGDYLRAVEPGLPAGLVPRDQWERILQIAERLPPVAIAGFERSLLNSEVAVDFAVHLPITGPAFGLLAERAASGELAALGWHGAANFLESLGQPGSPIAGKVGDVWLEFDASTGDERPSFFFSPSPAEKLSEIVANAAQASGLPAPVAGLLDRLDMLRGLPGEVFEIGLFLTRRDAAVRVCVTGLGLEGMVELLENLGGDPQWLELTEPLRPVAASTEKALLAFDLLPTGVRPPVGVELMLDSRKARPDPTERWRDLLVALTEADLCTPFERDVLLSWCGESLESDVGGRWPDNLTGFSVVAPWPAPCFVRTVHHVKLVMGEGLPRAKVYFGFLQGWQRHPPA